MAKRPRKSLTLCQIAWMALRETVVLTKSRVIHVSTPEKFSGKMDRNPMAGRSAVGCSHLEADNDYFGYSVA
jgi:hypothetical protein